MLTILTNDILQSLTEEDQSMIPRLAQMEDMLEKRNKIILKLKSGNASLKVCCFNL